MIPVDVVRIKLCNSHTLGDHFHVQFLPRITIPCSLVGKYALMTISDRSATYPVQNAGNVVSVLCYEGNCATILLFAEGLNPIKRAFLYVSASLVIIIAVIRSFFELMQLLVSKLQYLFDWVNWMEVITFAFSITFTFVFLTDCLCPTGWQWQLGCVAVFLTWIDLIIFIQKLPLTGYR